jgi:hypothetical protein
MTYLYVGSPYSHREPEIMEERYLAVAEFCADLAQTGNIPFSPIVHWHEIAKRFSLPRDAAFWHEQNMAMLAGAKALMVLTLPGWEDSVGLKLEIQACGRMSKPAFYSNPGAKWSKLF